MRFTDKSGAAVSSAAVSMISARDDCTALLIVRNLCESNVALTATPPFGVEVLLEVGVPQATIGFNRSVPVEELPQRSDAARVKQQTMLITTKVFRNPNYDYLLLMNWVWGFSSPL